MGQPVRCSREQAAGEQGRGKRQEVGSAARARTWLCMHMSAASPRPPEGEASHRFSRPREEEMSQPAGEWRGDANIGRVMRALSEPERVPRRPATNARGWPVTQQAQGRRQAAALPGHPPAWPSPPGSPAIWGR